MAGHTVRAAVVNGLGNARRLIRAIRRGEVEYQFVEVMACPGGCVGGGGQPIHYNEGVGAQAGPGAVQLRQRQRAALLP